MKKRIVLYFAMVCASVLHGSVVSNLMYLTAWAEGQTSALSYLTSTGLGSNVQTLAQIVSQNNIQPNYQVSYFTFQNSDLSYWGQPAWSMTFTGGNNAELIFGAVLPITAPQTGVTSLSSYLTGKVTQTQWAWGLQFLLLAFDTNNVAIQDLTKDTPTSFTLYIFDNLGYLIAQDSLPLSSFTPALSSGMLTNNQLAVSIDGQVATITTSTNQQITPTITYPAVITLQTGTAQVQTLSDLLSTMSIQNPTMVTQPFNATFDLQQYGQPMWDIYLPTGGTSAAPTFTNPAAFFGNIPKTFTALNLPLINLQPYLSSVTAAHWANGVQFILLGYDQHENPILNLTTTQPVSFVLYIFDSAGNPLGSLAIPTSMPMSTLISNSISIGIDGSPVTYNGSLAIPYPAIITLTGENSNVGVPKNLSELLTTLNISPSTQLYQFANGDLIEYNQPFWSLNVPAATNGFTIPFGVIPAAWQHQAGTEQALSLKTFTQAQWQAGIQFLLIAYDQNYKFIPTLDGAIPASYTLYVFDANNKLLDHMILTPSQFVNVGQAPTNPISANSFAVMVDGNCVTPTPLTYPAIVSLQVGATGQNANPGVVTYKSYPKVVGKWTAFDLMMFLQNKQVQLACDGLSPNEFNNNMPSSINFDVGPAGFAFFSNPWGKSAIAANIATAFASATAADWTERNGFTAPGYKFTLDDIGFSGFLGSTFIMPITNGYSFALLALDVNNRIITNLQTNPAVNSWMLMVFNRYGMQVTGSPFLVPINSTTTQTLSGSQITAASSVTNWGSNTINFAAASSKHSALNTNYPLLMAIANNVPAVSPRLPTYPPINATGRPQTAVTPSLSNTLMVTLNQPSSGLPALQSLASTVTVGTAVTNSINVDGLFRKQVGLALQGGAMVTVTVELSQDCQALRFVAFDFQNKPIAIYVTDTLKWFVVGSTTVTAAPTTGNISTFTLTANGGSPLAVTANSSNTVHTAFLNA